MRKSSAQGMTEFISAFVLKQSRGIKASMTQTKEKLETMKEDRETDKGVAEEAIAEAETLVEKAASLTGRLQQQLEDAHAEEE